MITALPVPLETARLLLRLLDPADAEQILETYTDPGVWEHIDRATASRSLAQKTRLRLERFIACQQERGFSFWAVDEKQSREPIGDCGPIPCDWHEPEIELGYRPARRWGQGFATEAATARITVAFEHLELDRIVAVAQAEHQASRRVMEKIGMVYEAAEGSDVVYVITRARSDRPSRSTG